MSRIPPFPDAEAKGSTKPDSYYVRDFLGVNQQGPRAAMQDAQFAWLENYIPIRPGNLRAMYAEGSTLFTTSGGRSIIYRFFYNIFAVAYVALFFDDGTATQVQISNGVSTAITTIPAFFYNGGVYAPAAVQWNSSGILIVTEAQDPNGYFAWDGAVLYSPGTASPSWLNNGSPTTMPNGIHGAAIEVYQSRVWVSAPPSSGIPATLAVSAPGNGASFSGTLGGGVFPQNDSTLKYQFTALKQANGFLYLIGDSNASVISNVLTSGSPLSTTFSQQNIDPQKGSIWPNTVQVFGPLVVFANPRGVFSIYGGTVQKISADIDQIFINANFQTVPTSATFTLFDVDVYAILINTKDYAGTFRNILCIWDGQKWFFGSTVNTGLLAIAGQEFNSVMTCWGNDGSNLFPMFQTPSMSLNKIFQTKLYAGGQNDEAFMINKKQYRFFIEVDDYSGLGASFTGTYDASTAITSISFTATPDILTFVNNSSAVIQFLNNSSQAIQFGVAGTDIVGIDGAVYGPLIGATQICTGSDYSIVSFSHEMSYDVSIIG